MTYSIVALDPATGDLGVAVQSKFLAVGAVVPWARAGVGAIATQSFANVTYGPDGLALWPAACPPRRRSSGSSPTDPLREQRQAGIVDAPRRRGDAHGRRVLRVGGRQTGPGFAAQGNILAGAAVVDGLVDTLRRPAAGRSRSCSSRALRRRMRRAATGAAASPRRC